MAPLPWVSSLRKNESVLENTLGKVWGTWRVKIKYITFKNWIMYCTVLYRARTRPTAWAAGRTSGTTQPSTARGARRDSSRTSPTTTWHRRMVWQSLSRYCIAALLNCTLLHFPLYCTEMHFTPPHTWRPTQIRHRIVPAKSLNPWPLSWQDKSLVERVRCLLAERETYSLYIWRPGCSLRVWCKDLTSKGWSVKSLLNFTDVTPPGLTS